MFVEILTLLALYLAVYIASTIWQNRHLPPGPFPFPVLGNLLSISQDQPYRDFANMAKKYGKLFRIQMGSKKAVVINSYEIAREALLTKAKDFAGRPPHFLGSIFGRNGSAIGFESFSERWKMQHKMLTAALRSTEDKANISLHIEELCSKNVFIVPTRRNVTKVGRPTENELFVVLEEGEYFSAPQEFALRGERR